MGLMSLFTPDTANKAVDGIYNGIDKAIYTEEEKAEMTQKQIETKLKMLPLFEPYKLAQRYIAIISIVNIFFAFWFGSFLIFMEMDQKLDKFIQLSDVFNLGWVLLAIIGWYFTNGALNGIVGKKKES